MVGIVYKYVSPSGKVYIGQTIEETRRRKTFMNLNKSYGGNKIDLARAKYGPKNFKYEILFKANFDSVTEAQKRLDELELYYIKLYNSYKDGYNMTLGGYTTTGLKLSETTKKLLSKIRTGKKLRPRTKEEKEYQSEVMKQKWASKEYRELRMKINQSEEHRKKRSESIRGEKNGMYGKKHTAITKEKMSESRSGEKNIWYGKRKQIEYREKIKNSMLAYYKEHPVSNETKKKIAQKISIPVKQFTMDGEHIAIYSSATEAGNKLCIDSSCIIKVCKGKRKSAGNYKWEYANVEHQEISWENALKSDQWLNIAEIVKKTGRNRNVVYYHIKTHGVPVIINGRRRLIFYPALLDIFKD